MRNIGQGVREIRIQSTGQFRIIYVARFEGAIHVLHAFQKKTQKTPAKDIDIAHRRYKDIQGELSMVEKYDTVWKALYDDPARAESLRIKSELMVRVEKYIQEKGLIQKEAAKILGVNQPRVSDLVRGKIDRFTIDMLINMLSRVGIKVTLKIEKAA